MSEPPPTNPDNEHLKLLRLFHFVCAAMAALVSCFPIIHLIVGIVFVAGGESISKKGDSPPMFIGWIFIGIASVLILMGWTFAALLAWAGRCLGRRKHYTFCMVMAGAACLFMPFGTALGVFTIIVLIRPSVKALFEKSSVPELSAPNV